MGFLDRFRRTPEPSEPSEPSERSGPGDGRTREQQADEVAESAKTLVDPAFLPLAEAEQLIEEMWPEEDVPDLSRDDVRAILHRVWAERLDIQGTWASEGDYVRLAAAFADLEMIGVVARMNFTCCQTCGHAEIDDERQESSIGYTFFHQQDSERLVPGEPSELFLAFGAFGPVPDLDPELVQRWHDGDAAAREQVIETSDERVGGAVVTALRAQGLVVDWDGTRSARIRLPDLDWRKSLPAG
jgi:hypothetical protein